ncbi:MAG TPA: sugar ABC transporter permease [bacterium]|nr:sugar ABC transporter permease [bacterium]HOX86780.1 sugar ABC transporter permease [bacterium]HPG46935.1 sugar ABC transporter permease [bacterium]HPM99299.1 sugar ABC transporter permease [bacterium]
MRRRITPILLLLPALVFTLFVLVYPLVLNLANAFRQVSLIHGVGQWVGLKNFVRVMQDEVFWLSLKNSILYAGLGTILSMVFGLFAALLLNIKIGRITSVFKLIYTIPWVISPVVAGFAWKWILNDQSGLINHWLKQLGLISDNITWLGSADTALLCVIIARVWQFFPFAMVMFFAGLQAIPVEQYEAADVDGAKSLDKLFHITLPNLRTVTGVLLLLGLIWSFNDFNMVFVMTRGGPIQASMVLPVLVREYSFVQFNLGKGSALSILIFMVLFGLSLLYLKVYSRRESL